MAVRSGVDMEKLLLVLTHSTGDCVAVRTRLPVPGVIPESPASNGWQPGFMTDLMAKDLDLAMAYAVRCGVPVPTTKARPPVAFEMARITLMPEGRSEPDDGYCTPPITSWVYSTL